MNHKRETGWQNILFDLDGTLTDPKEGITRSIQYALEELGQPVPTQDELAWCIGPPLDGSFGKLLQTDDPVRIGEAIATFRVRFGSVGKFENVPYTGISAVLAALQAAGKRLFVATSKPQVFAREIVDHFGLSGYFTAVYGSELDGTRMDKGELIGYLLAQEGLAAQETVMIGDRRHDVAGGKRWELATVGVAYGYGGRAELEAAGADWVVETPTALLNVLLSAPPAE